MAQGLHRSTYTDILHRSFPPLVFSAVNLISPAIIPAVTFLVLSHSFFQRRVDMHEAMSDPNFTDPFNYEAYDFIVIGGGSAGSVLARRLSVNNRVLLLEAGGDPHPLTLIPVTFPLMMAQPSIDWQYLTVPQKHAAFGFHNNRTVWPRGKSLGGCSVLNAMYAVRGNPKDYDNWANITGDPSWQYDRVLPFFKKLETYEGKYPNDEMHGNMGPIHVESMTHSPGQAELLRAAYEMGYPVGDMNTYQTEGFMGTDTTTNKGRRADTYRSYLRPIQTRKNLKISRYSYAFKIHLDLRKNAYAASYVRHGVRKLARANKEVIVSSGAINSPHLLMLSGIGPKRHLNSKGLKCRVNLPVGQNLQDHALAVMPPIIVNSSFSFLPDRDLSLSAGTDYIADGIGPLSSIPASTTGFLSSSMTDSSWPDIFVHQIPVSPHQGSSPIIRILEQVLGFRADLLASLLEENEGRDSFFNSVCLGRPFSRGEITLNSKDPMDKPLIDPKYYSDPRDVRVMIEGIKKLLDLVGNAPTFKSMSARVGTNPLKFCEKLPFGTDEYWECYVRTFTLTIYHPCCTCPMGKRHNDTRAVVDSSFRVLKTRNLRVVDASIMPVVTNANLNLPVIMMAEKASHIIREHWANQFLICRHLEYLASHVDSERMCYYSQLV